MNLVDEIVSDFRAPLERDPAVTHWLDVLLSYPGVHAVVAHRLIHRLYQRKVPILPRFLAHLVRCATGIEIHPSAQVGSGLFIDHGMGVVIGATAIVGKDVTLYQGVTLGGTSLDRTEKRHPTLGDNVIVGVGATVLGDIFVGANARIGAGSVVIKNVPDNATVVGIPGHVVVQDGVSVPSLEQRLRVLEAKLEQLQAELSRNGNGRNNDDVSTAL